MHIASGNMFKIVFSAILTACCIAHPAKAQVFDRDNIPLPEHPRPDFQRAQWVNLNGPWQFRFDAQNVGQKQEWFKGKVDFGETIMVPFSWGSKLSGVKDEADIGWYARDINVPQSWRGNRVFLVVGACDWHTTAWLNGNLLGQYQGGYTPFEFDLTPHIEAGKTHRLVLRVDDTPHRFKLQGKQGYGSASGVFDLADDPADHRGILSWHSQVRDYSKPAKDNDDLSFRDFKGGQLQEAGSYGYLVEARISPDALRKAQAEGVIRIRLEVDDSLPGGLAIYGERFGRYPLDPTLAFVLKN